MHCMLTGYESTGQVKVRLQSTIWKKNTDGWEKNSADIRISRIIA